MGAAIRAEVRKIFTTRLWWGLLIGVAVLSGGVAALFALLVGSDTAGKDPSTNPFLIPTVGTAQLVFAGSFVYLLAPLLPLALGVIVITQEFRHQTISPTLLATPRRIPLLSAKALAVVPVGIVYGLVHVVSAGAFGSLVLKLRGQPTFLDHAAVWGSFGLSLLAFVVWILLGYGFGLLVRNQLAAVFIALGVCLIGQILLQVVFSALGWSLPARLLPANLSVSMLVTSDPIANGGSGGDESYVAWWAATLILLGYAAVLSAIGSWLLNRRDVS